MFLLFFPIKHYLHIKSWKGVKFGTLKVGPKIQFSTQHLKENTTIFAHWIEQSGEYEGLQAFTL